MELPDPLRKALPRIAFTKVIITVAAFWAFAGWSVGVFPTDAFGEGFAKAEETAFNTKLILDRELLDTKRQQCKAASNDAAAFWTQKLIDLKDVYLKRLGKRYDEPSCAVLVVE